MTMKALENKLPAEEFIRVHRSYIVRKEMILLDTDIIIEGHCLSL